MDVPYWFRDAIAAPPAIGSVEVEGSLIAFRAWGARDRPGVVLVHGGGAHAGWWDHIAPMLSDEYRVVALDLSGHGDSGRRDNYTVARWAHEIVEVGDAAGIDGPPLIVAHSMGGWAAFTVGAEYPDRTAGVVIIDTPIRRVAPEEAAAQQRTAFGPLRVYGSEREALEHFRTVPDQPTSLPYLIEHVARSSLRPVEGGWVWKFDPAVFARDRPTPDYLRNVRCRVAVFRAENGLLTQDIGADMYELLGRRAPVIEIPLAWHHVMLDQPLSLVTGIRTLLADWEHSVPRGRPGV